MMALDNQIKNALKARARLAEAAAGGQCRDAPPCS